MTCVWTPDPSTLSEDWAGLPEEVRERALDLATSSLQMLTYYRVGTCPIKVRPCPPTTCRCDFEWQPVIWDGKWYNCRGCKARCAPAYEVHLEGPVTSIERITIDGVDLDMSDPEQAANWRIDNESTLVWQGNGPSPIPAMQNLNKADTEVGTWSVTYNRSYPVSQKGQVAVARMAMEYAKALTKGKGKCSLPRGVTNVVRNGVSFVIEAGMFPGGLTGDEIVDAFILQWAPAGAPVKTATVFDPKRLKPRRSTSPQPMSRVF